LVSKLKNAGTAITSAYQRLRVGFEREHGGPVLNHKKSVVGKKRVLYCMWVSCRLKPDQLLTDEQTSWEPLWLVRPLRTHNRESYSGFLLLNLGALVSNGHFEITSRRVEDVRG